MCTECSGTPVCAVVARIIAADEAPVADGGLHDTTRVPAASARQLPQPCRCAFLMLPQAAKLRRRAAVAAVVPMLLLLPLCELGAA